MSTITSNIGIYIALVHRYSKRLKLVLLRHCFVLYDANRRFQALRWWGRGTQNVGSGVGLGEVEGINTPLRALAVNKSPAVYIIFYHARSKDFTRK